MTRSEASTDGPADDAEESGVVRPLPGEPGIPSLASPTPRAVSWKGLFALAVLILTIGTATYLSIQRWIGPKSEADPTSKRAGDRPATASVEPRRLDLTLATAASTAASTPQAIRIPAIVPTEAELAAPIGVRPNAPTAAPAVRPQDAPVMLTLSRGGSAARRPADTDDNIAAADPLAQTRRNLEIYQKQLQVLLASLQSTTASSSTPTTTANPQQDASRPSTSPGTPALFGGGLVGSATPRVTAGSLGDRSLVLPKGTAFTCALKTKIVSATSGLIGCQVQRNVYGDDGKVLLVERGSHLDGEYRAASIKPGTVRIPVIWTRIRTPNGVVVDVASPGTGPLGESGVDGYIDNRWPERIGAALLLSLIDDSVQMAIQHESRSNESSVVLPSTTSTGSKLADKVLDSTINIPPSIYQNQGGIVGIHVARDVDFSTVYELKSTPR